MKFIPLESFDQINSLLEAVEAQGCLLTIRLEAFTCRNTKEEKELASAITQNMMKLQSTPPITPSPIVVQSQDGTFPLVETLPPPLVLGASAFSHEMPYTPDVNERLIYFAAALNSIYSEDGYDFSVLTENDFVCLNEEQVKGEVQIYLQSLPDVCGPAVQHFWEAIFELVLDAAQGCEYY
ncbi:hypothetical protein AGDE_00028, partial [Angomonas deanei]